MIFVSQKAAEVVVLRLPVRLCYLSSEATAFRGLGEKKTSKALGRTIKHNYSHSVMINPLQSRPSLKVTFPFGDYSNCNKMAPGKWTWDIKRQSSASFKCFEHTNSVSAPSSLNSLQRSLNEGLFTVFQCPRNSAACHQESSAAVCVLELSMGHSSTKTFTLLSYDKLPTPGESRFIL